MTPALIELVELGELVEVVALTALLLTPGCGAAGSPVRPSDPSGHSTPSLEDNQLTTGSQWLELIGFGLSKDPDFPPCAPLLVPYDGTGVVTPVDLARDRQEWVARSSRVGAGNVELRFHENGHSRMGRSVAGTIRGVGVNVQSGRDNLPLRDVRTILAGPSGIGAATVEGTIAGVGSFVLGSMSGEIRFSDSFGNSSTCSKILWTMQPMTGFPNSDDAE
ncbi:MAG: hypothetical protein C5B57_08800 [Blastocatellia bacterium]|nr:MAG: hypothetical protein C5B57_08800 [Blastocatellia bacterium]